MFHVPLDLPELDIYIYIHQPSLDFSNHSGIFHAPVHKFNGLTNPNEGETVGRRVGRVLKRAQKKGPSGSHSKDLILFKKGFDSVSIKKDPTLGPRVPCFVNPTCPVSCNIKSCHDFKCQQQARNTSYAGNGSMHVRNVPNVFMYAALLARAHLKGIRESIDMMAVSLSSVKNFCLHFFFRTQK